MDHLDPVGAVEFLGMASALALFVYGVECSIAARLRRRRDVRNHVICAACGERLVVAGDRPVIDEEAYRGVPS